MAKGPSRTEKLGRIMQSVFGFGDAGVLDVPYDSPDMFDRLRRGRPPGRPGAKRKLSPPGGGGFAPLGRRAIHESPLRYASITTIPDHTSSARLPTSNMQDSLSAATRRKKGPGESRGPKCDLGIS